MLDKIFKCTLLLFIITLFSFSGQAFAEGGYAWTEQTGSGSRYWFEATSSADGTKIVAIDNDDSTDPFFMYASTNSGVTWTPLTGAGAKYWYSVASSADGTKLAAVEGDTGYIYTSTDSGANWTQRTSTGAKNWQTISMSADGTKMVASEISNGRVWVSTDSGANWTQKTLATGFIRKIAMSADGTKMYASITNRAIYASFDSGTNWAALASSGVRSWYSIASSSDGTKLAAVTSSNGNVYTSTDSGTNWTQQTGAGGGWYSISSSADGTRLLAGTAGGYLYTSLDSGVTWTQQTSAGTRVWYPTVSSADGTKVLAGVSSGGYLYTGLLDATAPTITTISSDKTNGSYKAGEVIDIDVTFSETVTSTGLVTVTLETGTTDRTCTFTVTSSTTGTCNYTVQAGDTSSDLTVLSISGTIADVASNAMTNFVPTTNLAANKALVIDTTASVITTVLVSDISSSGATITWTTDENASSIVDYGPTDAYALSTAETDTPTGLTTHSITLSGLSSCNTYHYRVKSRDIALNLATSSDGTFATPGCVTSGSSAGSRVANLFAMGKVDEAKKIIAQFPNAFSAVNNIKNNTGISSEALASAITTTLRKGSKNEVLVKVLQQFLNAKGALLVIDGKFGPMTFEAVKAFQSKHDLTADGIVGPKTWKVISLLNLE